MGTGVVTEAQGDTEELLVEVAGCGGRRWLSLGRAHGKWNRWRNGAPGPSRCGWWLEDRAPARRRCMRTRTTAWGRLTRWLAVAALGAHGVAMGSTKRRT
jgi:hypothetical protein